VPSLTAKDCFAAIGSATGCPVWREAPQLIQQLTGRNLTFRWRLQLTFAADSSRPRAGGGERLLRGQALGIHLPSP